MIFKCEEPGCNALISYKDENALAEDGKWEYWSSGEFYCPKHWRSGKPLEERIILDNYKETKYRQGMTKLIITRPPHIQENMPHWEPELSYKSAEVGWEGYGAGHAFASIKECIDWAKEELAKPMNFNKFGKPDKDIEIIIYKAVNTKRIKLVKL